MKKEFIKMHGLGNDFVIFDGRETSLFFTPERIAALGDRHTGIGFDQLIVIDPPRTPDTAAFMRIFNVDGTEVSACGNATRCVAKLLSDELKNSSLVIETKAGKLSANVSGDRISVDMGKVKLKWQEIPLSREENTLSLSVSEGALQNPVAVNVGNPHAVFFVNQLDSAPLEKFGPLIETHHLFPEKTNVEAVQVISRTKLRMRVWERGCGITRACGTGACAAAVAAVRRDLADRKVTVVLDGGALDIEWRESDAHVVMTGEATEVFRGVLADDGQS